MGKSATPAPRTEGHKGKEHSQTPEPSKEPALKATFTAVMLLGGFIIVSWVLVMALFLTRN